MFVILSVCVHQITNSYVGIGEYFGRNMSEGKGLEDFSANPVTLRGNILRMR